MKKPDMKKTPAKKASTPTTSAKPKKGVKIRGTGAAIKGTMANGPMA